MMNDGTDTPITTQNNKPWKWDEVEENVGQIMRGARGREGGGAVQEV